MATGSSVGGVTFFWQKRLLGCPLYAIAVAALSAVCFYLLISRIIWAADIVLCAKDSDGRHTELGEWSQLLLPASLAINFFVLLCALLARKD